jgi:DNA-binding LacI/PurR family transcriptional regulator
MESIARPALLRDQVVRILKGEILHGRPTGSSMPSEPELARQLKVSRNTVRAAYAALEADGLIERRRGKGTFLIAKMPHCPRTGDVAVVFFTSAGHMFLLPFYSRMIGEICGRAAAAAFYVNLLTHDPKRSEFRYDWREHAARLEEAVGALAVGVFRPAALEALARRMPLVAADAGGPFAFCDSVVADDFEAGRLATEHLLELGHRRIGFVGQVRAEAEVMLDPAHVRRYEGFCEAMGQAQMWPGEDLLFDTQGAGRAAYRAVGAALQRPDCPTAFVCVDDTAALGGVDAAIAHGLCVPQDVSFVGIGDAVPSTVQVGLTTVDLGPEQIGRTAVEQLQRRLAEPAAPPAHRVVPVRLIERHTTARATW